MTDNQWAAHQDLQRCRSLLHTIRMATEKLEELDTRYQKIVPALDRVSVNGGAIDCQGDSVAGYIDQRKQWVDEIRRAEAEHQAYETRIADACEDLPTERAVLTLYYISGQHLREIGNVLDYSREQINRYRHAALDIYYRRHLSEKR